MNLKKISRGILILIPVIMVSWHLYASNFQHLTRWKGNGYGMYTDSHGEYRSIVFIPDQTNEKLQVYPLKNEEYLQLDEENRTAYLSSYKTLKLAAFYPERYENQLKESTWYKGFASQKGSFELYRTDLDLDAKKVKSVKVYIYE